MEAKLVKGRVLHDTGSEINAIGRGMFTEFASELPLERYLLSIAEPLTWY